MLLSSFDYINIVQQHFNYITTSSKATEILNILSIFFNDESFKIKNILTFYYLTIAF